MLASIRSCLFILIMAVTVIFWATATVLCAPLPVRVRYDIASSWPRLMLKFGRWICGMRWQVIGTENLPDHPVIVLCKHQSTWETFFLVSQMPRHAAFVFKREILFIPFFGWAIGMLDMMHIDRRQGRRAFASIVKSAPHQFTEHNRWIVMFPEGTRIPAGRMGEYKSGGARLAVQNDTPILPVAVNAGRLWPKKPFIKKPGLITVSYGPVISVSGKSADQVNREVETWIETEMRRIDADSYAENDKVYTPRH
ncbi:MAG: lysophospholipid acyltransferase family protein [Lautropia sp.]|nr:lysophospholipid acyltransferase family protein [Lautropia sp.]